NAWESVGAFGVVWTALALLALWLGPPAAVRFHGALLVLMILCAFHDSTPLYPLLQRVLPGLALFRIPTRFLLLAGFPLGMLAGCLAQRIFGANRERGTSSGRTLALAGCFVGAFVTLYLLLSVPNAVHWHPYWMNLVVVGPGAVAVLWWCAWRKPTT